MSNEGKQSPLAPMDDVGLTTISVGKLMAGDPAANEKLFRASKDLGFFYIDIRDHPTEDFEQKIGQLKEIALEFYSLPQEQKDVWEVNKDHEDGKEIIMGYKPAGIQTGPVAGKKDGFEGCLIFQDALNAAPRDSPISAPNIFKKNRELLQSFNAHMANMGRLILDSLSCSLKYTAESNLAAKHRDNRPSTTALGLLKYLPYSLESDKVGHIPHTDIGSLSMVFSDVAGLQVYHPRKKTWMFIEPQPGHTVCNIGDSVEFLSQNVLHSSLHRVIPHPSQKDEIKLTVVYLMRPETNTVFVDRDGREWKSVDWHNRKNRLFAEEMESQASDFTLTGRDIGDDLWDEDKDDFR
ncbi:Oxoglutarate/iron-dependent oxygenase [Beauveria brongniartii RCEF 3172]|uniref:Oxoglutarate/iron-dependent oxygenase n=1 Tax=Beauveria brongniartii RCEF 3172 TaxID=1081107 RepID=A0A166S262_9HYPO|nr:Oxoglutarate/iron-dependent oxygenase [Beauveria brongniartii RCEF 3172]